MNKELKITARNDYAFKHLFNNQDKKEIFIEFVSQVTGIRQEEFEEIAMQQNKQIEKIYNNDKYGIVDVKARLKDGRKINIEMQNKYDKIFPKRTIYYWSKIYIEDLKQSENYYNLTKTISINILNEPFPKTDKLHSIYQILEKQDYSILEDVLEIHYLDMTKLKTKKGKSIIELLEEDENNIKKADIKQLSLLEKWLIFIQTNSKEVRDMLSNESRALKTARDEMERFYSDDIQRELYFTADKYEKDKATFKEIGRLEGIEEGIQKGIQKGKIEGIQEGIQKGKIEGIQEGIQKGIQKGKIEGIQEGIQKGKIQGIEEGRINIAKNLLKMNMDIETIIKATGLDRDKINSLL